MKLFLHIGTEKTGSSFLQKLSGRSRDFLCKQGVFFPDGGRDERRLLRGTISPGNARELSQLMGRGRWGEVSRWLDERIRIAKARSCNRLLLSHELLFSSLSSDKSVAQFETAAELAGVESITLLLMVRDPIDQAVSLYKHRAKNGSIGDIGTWIESSFTTPEEIESFLRQMDSSPSGLYIRKYQKNTESIVRSFFCDWLKVKSPPIAIETVVNPSLTFSELKIIAHVASSSPEHVPMIYKKFLDIPLACKASDAQLEKHARLIAENYLHRFNSLWRDLDRRLQFDGGLSIPVGQEVQAAVETTYRFSATQLNAWADGERESRMVHYRAKLWIDRNLRSWLGHAKMKLRTLLKGQKA